MTDLSIIVVSYKGWKRLSKCLEELNLYTGHKFTTEVIVVDNHSDDVTLNIIMERFPGFKFILNSSNGGYANGCNLGAQNASGDFLLFLNPDTVASESEIEKLFVKAKQNPDYTILSCRQVNEKGKESIASGSFPQFTNLTGFQRAVFKQSKSGTVIDETEVIFPDWVSGSVVLMKRDYFQKIKGFDEDYWMYFEDVDLCKRVRDKGCNVAFCRDITIEHNHGGSSRISMNTTSLTKTEVLISQHVYINKHKSGIERALIQTFLIINNIVFLGCLGLLGLLFFFVPKVFVRTLIFVRLITYYAGSILRLSWLSPRSVNFHK